MEGSAIATMGIDIGKNSFHMIGLDAVAALALGLVRAAPAGHHPNRALRPSYVRVSINERNRRCFSKKRR
jgi:hypothetical protein